MTAVILITLVVFAATGVISFVRKLRKKNAGVWKWIALVAFLAFWVAFGVEANDPGAIMTLSSFLLAAVALAFFVIAAVRRVRKKPLKKQLVTGLVLLLTAVVVFSLSLGVRSGFSTSLYLLSFVAGAVSVFLLLAFAVSSLRSKSMAKRQGLVTAVSFCLMGVLIVASNICWDMECQSAFSNAEAREAKIQIEPGFVVQDEAEPLVVEEYYASEATKISSETVHVYDSEHLNLLIEKTGATEQDCLDAIAANSDIDDQFKGLLEDYVRRFARTFPDASMDILATNLRTLTFTELSRTDYVRKSMSVDSLGVYFCDENAIYVPAGTTFVEGNGEFGFQVIMHEISHAARNYWKNGSYRTCADFSSIGGGEAVLLEEAMNSVFSCDLLSYYEWDIAYQVPSNYMRILLECMDNYKVSDYINHSDTYFLSKLDEASGHVNYAKSLWKLVTLQRADYQSEGIALPEEEYFPIYDFLCELWYSRHITNGMSYEQARAVADDLVYRAFYDAPSTYTITPQRFYDNLDAYLVSLSSAA